MDSPSGTPSVEKKQVAKLSDHDGDDDTLVNVVSMPQSKSSTTKSSEPVKVGSYIYVCAILMVKMQMYMISSVNIVK